MLTDLSLTTTTNQTAAAEAGDLLLLFGRDASGLPARSSDVTWEAACRTGESTLWQSAPGDGWRGAPLTMVRSGAWQAWLVGELYGSPDPAAAVAGVLAGERDAATLNGHFLLLAHDQESNRWHLWTNRSATYHAYLGAHGGRKAVGTHFPSVAAASAGKGLDWAGLNSFFALGFFGGDRTFLKDVRQLRPATHLILEADGSVVSEERYWEWWFSPDEASTLDDQVVAFGQLFGSVMDEMSGDGPVAVPISGGLDSRSTVAALSKRRAADSNIWAYSYGYDPFSIETNIARQVAAARHMRFDAFTIQPYLFDRLDNVIDAVEGFQDVTQSRQASVGEALQARGGSVIAAHWGDVMLGDLRLVGVQPDAISPDGLIAHAIQLMSKPGHLWLIDHLCRPQLSGDDPGQLLRQGVGSELDRVSHLAEPEYRLKAYKTDQWSARWTTASLRMFQAAVFPRLPFYDTRLADYFATVPSGHVAGRRLQIEYLKRYAPDLARITWQQSGRDLFNDQPGLFDLPRRAWRKGWRMATGQKVIERNWEVQFLSERGRRGLEQWLLAPGLALHDLAAPAELTALLDAFYREPLAEKRGYTISMLLTFSAWLERMGGEWL